MYYNAQLSVLIDRYMAGLYLHQVQSVKEMDAKAIASGTPGIVLMKKAGRAAFECLCERWPGIDSLVVLCGSGNNGGDGYIVAGLAKLRGFNVEVFSTKPVDQLSGDAKSAALFAQNCGLGVRSLSELDTYSPAYDFVVVDALLGTGVTGDVRPNYRAAIEWANKDSKPVIALDLPSGIDGDTGHLVPFAIKANVTVSFIGRKKGLYTSFGKESAGEVELHELDVAESIVAEPSTIELLRPHELLKQLSRGIDSHKGSHGRVAVIGGELGMGGAAMLSAEASVLSGAGLTHLYSREAHVLPSLARLPEVMVSSLEETQGFADSLLQASSVVLGPGLGSPTGPELLLVRLCSLWLLASWMLVL